MFQAKLSAARLWEPILRSGVLVESLQWIAEHAQTAPAGLIELGRPDWFVNVHGYATQSPDLCIWENHLSTIDIQYMIEGIEGIDVTPVETLGEPKLFKPASDTQKFAAAGGPATRVVLEPDDFVILLPGEAHRPKVAIGEPAELRKLVVKVPVSMLRGG